MVDHSSHDDGGGDPLHARERGEACVSDELVVVDVAGENRSRLIRGPELAIIDSGFVGHADDTAAWIRSIDLAISTWS